MAVYNKLTQNKQGKGPVFYLLEKTSPTHMDIALARGENKQQPMKPQSGGQQCSVIRTYLDLCMHISTERS